MLPKIFLLFLGLVVHLVAAQADLGVTLDASLLFRLDGSRVQQHEVERGIRAQDLNTTRSFFAWTSILTFEKNQPTSDEELAAIAKQGYIEMREASQRMRLHYKTPAVMTALHVGKKVYLGSSIKGGRTHGGSLVYTHRKDEGGIGETRGNTPERMAALLGSCVGKNEELGFLDAPKQHRTEGSCGEISTLYLWYSDNEGVDRHGTEMSIVAWNGVLNGGRGKVVDPCGKDANDWGCKLLTEQAKVTPVMGKKITPSKRYPTPSNKEFRALWQQERDPVQRQ